MTPPAMNRPQKYPPPRVSAVDVDGTLHRNGVANQSLIEWCRKQKESGFKLMLWSSRGEDYARKAAELFGVVDLFHVICSKPGYVVDDQGWSWIKYTRVMTAFAEE